MCRWQLHPHPALVSDPCSVVPRESIILVHNADTARVPSCICSIREIFPLSVSECILVSLIPEVTVAQITVFLFTEHE